MNTYIVLIFNQHRFVVSEFTGAFEGFCGAMAIKGATCCANVAVEEAVESQEIRRGPTAYWRRLLQH